MIDFDDLEMYEVFLNQQPCRIFAVDDASDTAGDGGSIFCQTAPRPDLAAAVPRRRSSSGTVSSDPDIPAIPAMGVVVRMKGKGFALVPELVRFRYLDKWSDSRSWTGGELPLDGDMVVIPVDQSILIDVNTPILSLVLVQGLLVVDNRHLNIDATYIWVHGGAFEAGLEEAPFEYNLTMTFHGDRWDDVELPFVGAK